MLRTCIVDDLCNIKLIHKEKHVLLKAVCSVKASEEVFRTRVLLRTGGGESEIKAGTDSNLTWEYNSGVVMDLCFTSDCITSPCLITACPVEFYFLLRIWLWGTIHTLGQMKAVGYKHMPALITKMQESIWCDCINNSIQQWNKLGYAATMLIISRWNGVER